MISRRSQRSTTNHARAGPICVIPTIKSTKNSQSRPFWAFLPAHSRKGKHTSKVSSAWPDTPALEAVETLNSENSMRRTSWRRTWSKVARKSQSLEQAIHRQKWNIVRKDHLCQKCLNRPWDTRIWMQIWKKLIIIIKAKIHRISTMPQRHFYQIRRTQDHKAMNLNHQPKTEGTIIVIQMRLLPIRLNQWVNR